MDRYTIRRALVALVLKNRRPGHGSQPTLFRERTAIMQVPDLRTILGDIPWVLAGALALRAYAPERATQDVDILIHLRDTHRAEAAFRGAGYRVVGPLSIGGFTVVPPTAGPAVDVLVSAEAWVDLALSQPAHDAAGIPVLPRPYLALLKLRASRSQDLPDLTKLIGLASDGERAAIRAVIAHEEPAHLDDYDQIALLADLEFGDLRTP